MWNPQIHRGLLRLKTLEFQPLLLQLHLFSRSLTTTASNPHSFTASYLVNNCGFTPDSALRASCKFRFHNPEKPDSVLAFFRTRGFSDSHIHAILKRVPRLLLCDPDKVLSPKFEFLRSKGASSADIVHILSTGPTFLSRSLDNHIVSAFEFVRGFFQSDEQIIACMMRNSGFLSDGRVALNAKLLLDHGVKRSDITNLLRRWPTVLCSFDLVKTIEELKEMGFDPSTSTFCIALLAKRTVNKAKWDEKVEILKRWGWSQEHVIVAFKKQPYCMLTSGDKIEALMSIWVDRLGFDSLELVRGPNVFQFSLQKRIVPRALVIKSLESKGLRKKGASMITPLMMTETLFLEKFVKRFEGDSSCLLKMYEENMNLSNDREKYACL